MSEDTRKMFDLTHQRATKSSRDAQLAHDESRTLWTISSDHMLDHADTFRTFGVRAIYDQHGALVEIPSETSPETPPWMSSLFDLARSQGACVISFDRRGVVIDGYPTRGEVTSVKLSTLPRSAGFERSPTGKETRVLRRY